MSKALINCAQKAVATQKKWNKTKFVYKHISYVAHLDFFIYFLFSFNCIIYACAQAVDLFLYMFSKKKQEEKEVFIHLLAVASQCI